MSTGEVRGSSTAFDGLLLDVGGPLTVLPFEYLGEVERSYGLPPGTLAWRGPFDPATDPLWRDYGAGLLSEREYWTQWAEEVERAAGRGGGVREFFATVYQRLGEGLLRPEVVTLVVDARAAGIRVGALSNDAGWLLPAGFFEARSVLSDLDAFVDLSRAEVRKPEGKAYAIALDALGLAPEQVLFVDDDPLNVAGAEAVGLHALRFDVTDVAASIRGIRGRLGLAA